MSVWQWFTDPANWTGPNGIPTRTLQHIWISFAAMAIADLTTYVVSAAQLALAHPDLGSGFGGSFAKFLGIFAFTQVPLAVAEGILGLMLFGFLDRAARPHLVRLGLATEEPSHA